MALPVEAARRRAARRADAEYGSPAEPDWREVDWPPTPRVRDPRRRQVNYVDLGDGERAGRLRPRPGRLLAELAREPSRDRARATASIALDLPGFGRSDMPREPITITRFAQTVDELCGDLGLGHVASSATRWAASRRPRLAIRHPDRVERLVLVDAAGISLGLGRNWLSERCGSFIVTGGSAAPPAHRERRCADARPGSRADRDRRRARHPTLLARDLVAEQLSVGAPGFMPALER